MAPAWATPDPAAWGVDESEDAPKYSRQSEYRKVKDRVMEQLIDRAEEKLGDLRSHILWQEAATPMTQTRYTLSSGGSSYGIELATDQFGPLRLEYRTPIGGLILGATLFLYDGAPDYPGPDRLWAMAARHRLTHLGLSPTLIRALLKFGEAPVRGHDLSALRAFASTGEPWNPDPWLWLFNVVGEGRRPIINYSGGTEIAGGILMGNPLLPIKPCSFPAPCLGMDVDILDEEGNPVGPGEVGELVIKQPWIGMARGFWQEKERYLDTYWRRFKDIWVHGDFAMRDKDGHWFILGRSDDTLKVAGKRVGPAEVESLLVAHPLVTEAAVIGVPDEVKGTAMVAFVVLSEPGAISTGLQAELKALVAKDMGKPLAPSKIHFVSALPKTRNAKVMRRVIRSAYLGDDPGDLSALENPQAVDEIRTLGFKG